MGRMPQVPATADGAQCDPPKEEHKVLMVQTVDLDTRAQSRVGVMPGSGQPGADTECVSDADSRSRVLAGSTATEIAQ